VAASLRLALPVTYPSLLRWALQSGFSLLELVAVGTYEAPAGAYMPSAWY